MDFGFSDEQELLRGQARDFLDRECPTARVRELMATESGHDQALHRRIAELGWTAIPFPESAGGLGLGYVDLVVVLEEMGRHVTPSSLQSSILFGATVVAAGDEAQTARLLRGVCDGTTAGTVALVEESGRWDAAGVRMEARRDGDGYVLDGTKLFVPDAHLARTMLVAARTADDPVDGVTLLAVDTAAAGVGLRRMATMDQTRRLFEVTFDGVRVGGDAVVGAPDHGWRVLARGLDRAMVAVCAEMCGVMQRVMEMSVEYAKTRRQFGRPIGTFQGVSHRCADMLVAVESARSLTYHAAWAVDGDVPEAPLAAAMAKAYVSDAARQVAGSGIQVHGGIGFTWEHDVHLYFKRAKWGEAVYGDAVLHRERVASLLEL